MIKFAAISSCILLSLSTGICYAAHPLITDDAGTLGKGHAQIEINYEYERVRDHAAREREFSLGSSISYGIFETGDVILSAPYLWTRTSELGESEKERGIGDMVIELKWRWYEKDGLGLAFKPGLILPTGNDRRGLGSGKVGYQFYLIATKEMNPVVLHGNAGYIANKNTGGDREDLWHVSLAGELPLGEHLRLVANSGIERDTEPSFRRDQAFFLAGLIFALTKWCDIDGGLKYLSTRHGSHGWSLLTGITLRF